MTIEVTILYDLFIIILFAIGSTYIYLSEMPNELVTTRYKVNRYHNKSFFGVTDGTRKLHLNGNNSFENGFDHGILLAEEIMDNINLFKKRANIKIPAWKLNDINKNLHINIRSELKGLTSAINSMYPGKVTYWDLLGFQLFTEFECFECITYAAKNKNDKVIFGHSINWPVNYDIEPICIKYQNYTSMSIPGFIGCITAHKDYFALATNFDMPKQEPNNRFLPNSLFNKNIMICANTFDEAIKIASNNKPRNSCYLTIADYKDVYSFKYELEKTLTFVKCLN